MIELLGHALPKGDPSVIFGPGLGRDAAVIDFGERYLVAKTDPITFATDNIGWYVMNINANDVACLGATPRWFIITLLLPEGQTNRLDVETVFNQLREAGQQLGVSVVGGHTEITHAIDRPIAVGAMLGDVAPEKLVRSDGGQPGDHLILTKSIAVEGSAIIVRELGERLAGHFAPAMLDRVANFLHKPGISVVKDARIATSAGRVHAMHDPTEGGVATGIRELTEAAGLGAVIEAAALPFFPETRALCEFLDLDPLGLIASGSLLIAAPPEDAVRIVAALQAAGIPAVTIGALRKQPGVLLHDTAGTHDLPRFARDEIARLFERTS